MSTPIPPELLEKIEGGAVLGPDDTLVLVLPGRTSRKEFDLIQSHLIEACGGRLAGRVVAVAVEDAQLAVLRG